MAKVLGVGGIFFKSPDPETCTAGITAGWARRPTFSTGLSFMPQTIPPGGLTVFSAFKDTTTYFAPSAKAFMFNLMVDNLEEALAQVKEGGAENRRRDPTLRLRQLRVVHRS